LYSTKIKAKQSTAKIYIPILVISNILYVVLMLGTSNSIPYNGTKFGIFGMIITWLMQAYSYVGIIESSAIEATASKKNNKDLAGGSNLDLFVATIVTQFLSVLHSQKWFYVTLVGVPLTGAYKLYYTFYPSSSKNKSKSTTSTSAKTNDNKDDNKDDDPMTEKRKRRADKRRQKWS
jgi:hypothetical protein